jgi:F-type H+-transporting ATPase subunit delta
LFAHPSRTIAHAQAIYNSTEVTQVNIAASTGDMGILASHVPSVEELRPGVLEVVESSGTKKWFVSGGFATVHPNNKLVVNAIEAYPLDNFSTEAVRSALSEAQRVASSSSSAEAKAEAEIEIEVYTALQAALGRS